jgi:glycerol-3-phosphate dehydrogenase
MKNRLSDLNNHLFMQLERLADEGLTGEQIESEVKRADAIVSVADKIVDNARLQLQACKLVADHGDRFMKHLPMIAAPEKETGQ